MQLWLLFDNPLAVHSGKQQTRHCHFAPSPYVGKTPILKAQMLLCYAVLARSTIRVKPTWRQSKWLQSVWFPNANGSRKPKHTDPQCLELLLPPGRQKKKRRLVGFYALKKGRNRPGGLHSWFAAGWFPISLQHKTSRSNSQPIQPTHLLPVER